MTQDVLFWKEMVFMNKRAMKLRQTLRRLAAGVLACSMLAAMFPAEQVYAKAASGTTTLRILSTTDLHGQSTTLNYDSATVHKKGSLAQAATLINDAKNDLKYGNTLLVDIGDTIYGYGTDVIHDGRIDGPEYMYEELAALGYDALTVGNHDFDYGYEYLQKQLEASGLDEKTVVSNVYDAKTKKNVWAENMVLTKQLRTTKGASVSVKIGLIGVTKPTLTTHYDHSLLLTTKDMVESVREQVEKLETKNVDLIVVLAHSGIGSDDYVQMSESAAYEISKIKGVDAIVGGHAHVNFPSTDANVQKYYDYSGVSADGRLNGVPYVAVADHGAGIGMLDLKLKVTNGTVSVSGSSAKVKKVKNSTPENATVMEINDAYQEQFDELYATSLAAFDGTATTYFAPVEDNIVIQLANEAKIHYGLEYISQEKPHLKDLPVIAATSYGMAGKGSPDDVVVDGAFSIEDSLKIQNKNKEFAFIYGVTGSDIREWLEWQASAYQQPDAVGDGVWQDAVVERYAKEGSLTPVLNPEWMDDWSGFVVFDGIEYEMDPSGAPRYNKAGTLTNKKAHRIVSLTCNGKEVTDDMEFALVCPRLNSSFCKVATSRSEYVICNRRVYLNDLLQDYLKEQNGYAPLSAKPDNNWNVRFPEQSTYLLKASGQSAAAAAGNRWYEKTLERSSKYAYYQMSLDESAVTEGSAPLLVVGLGKTKQTSHGVPILVQASDRSGIRAVKYYPDVVTADADVWDSAARVSGDSFEVRANGVYTVMAEDAEGHRTVKYMRVDNYDKDALEAPEVTKCTNRSKSILGTSEPDTTVYAVADGITYSADTAEDGTFAIGTPKLPADLEVSLWAEDANGRQSAVVSCTVKRTGANELTVDAITNKSQAITGQLNDSQYNKVIAITSDTVYVPKDGGTQAYEHCSVYDWQKKIETVDYEVSGGNFRLHIPVPLAGAKYTLYSLDWTDKNSVKTSMVAEEVAPNQPRIRKLYAVDNCVYGRVPAPDSESYEISVSDGSQTYVGTAAADGRFAVTVGDLPEGTQLTVTATDQKDGVARTSAKAAATVLSCDSLKLPENTAITFDPVDSKMTTVSGRMSGYSGALNLLIGKTRVSVQVAPDGAFAYELKTPRAAGTGIVAMARDAEGGVMDANSTSVTLALPDAPQLLTETVYDTTETIELYCVDRAMAVVKIGSKYYKSQKAAADKENGGYIYTVTIKKQPKAGEPVIIYMMNETGKSGKLQTVVEADPEAEEDAQDESADGKKENKE